MKVSTSLALEKEHIYFINRFWNYQKNSKREFKTVGKGKAA